MPYYCYYLNMHKSEVGRSVGVTVRKLWLTDSYEATVEVREASGDVIERQETVYGPLWEAWQVEQLVWNDARRLAAKYGVLDR